MNISERSIILLIFINYFSALGASFKDFNENSFINISNPLLNYCSFNEPQNDPFLGPKGLGPYMLSPLVMDCGINYNYNHLQSNSILIYTPIISPQYASMYNSIGSINNHWFVNNDANNFLLPVNFCVDPSYNHLNYPQSVNMPLGNSINQENILNEGNNEIHLQNDIIDHPNTNIVTSSSLNNTIFPQYGRYQDNSIDNFLLPVNFCVDPSYNHLNYPQSVNMPLGNSINQENTLSEGNNGIYLQNDIIYKNFTQSNIINMGEKKVLECKNGKELYQDDLSYRVQMNIQKNGHRSHRSFLWTLNKIKKVINEKPLIEMWKSWPEEVIEILKLCKKTKIPYAKVKNQILEKTGSKVNKTSILKCWKELQSSENIKRWDFVPYKKKK